MASASANVNMTPDMRKPGEGGGAKSARIRGTLSGRALRMGYTKVQARISDEHVCNLRCLVPKRSLAGSRQALAKIDDFNVRN